MKRTGVIAVLGDEFHHHITPLAICAGMVMGHALAAVLAPIERHMMKGEERARTKTCTMRARRALNVRHEPRDLPNGKVAKAPS